VVRGDHCIALPGNLERRSLLHRLAAEPASVGAPRLNHRTG
jgi:hypothetical protein